MDDTTLRRHLVELLGSRNAHVDFDQAISGWPSELRGVRPEGHPHTAWQLLEHLRIAQWDILEFSRREDHVSPEWPAGYWPKREAPSSEADWEEAVAAFHADLRAMCALIEDPATDLLAALPWSEGGATVLREALLLADHNAYHIGQLVTLRRALGAWPA